MILQSVTEPVHHDYKRNENMPNACMKCANYSFCVLKRNEIKASDKSYLKSK